MKLLKCIVRPNALDKVKDALRGLSIPGMTVRAAQGLGRQKGHKELYRGAEYTIDFTPKLEIEVVVKEDLAAQVIDAVRDAAQSGKIGDGKIFVLAVEDVVRIRTGETGEAAI